MPPAKRDARGQTQEIVMGARLTSQSGCERVKAANHTGIPNNNTFCMQVGLVMRF